jgi:hypothetical protein
MHVADRALLSFESYARLIMRGLGREVPLVRVPDDLWHATELPLPIGKGLHCSFIDSSLLLDRLGWQPTDEATWVTEYASYLADHPLKKSPQRQLELSLLGSMTAEPVLRERNLPSNWCITGRGGRPSSLLLQHEIETRNPALPLLKCKKVALGITDELFLTEGSDAPARTLGQNALLEVVEPGDGEMRPGDLYVPFGVHSCAASECTRCAQLQQTMLETDQEGFARELVQEDPVHLTAIPREIAGFALLVHPLSCLLSVLPYVVHNATGPVWFYGQRVESVLAAFIAEDAGISAVHIDRSRDRGILPEKTPLHFLEKARDGVKNKSLPPPAAVVNLSGMRDGENLLSAALQHKGLFVSPFVATGVHARRLTVNLPVLSPGKMWLEMAASTIQRWAKVRDLVPLLRRVSLEQLPELCVSSGFQLPYMEIGGGAQ